MDTTLLEQEGMYERWPGLKHIIRMERERTGTVPARVNPSTI